MSPEPTPKIEKALKLDYDKGRDDIWLTEQNSLRKLIGVLGMLLPLLLFLFVFISDGHDKPLYSISHYYFTRASSVFVIVVSLLAIFLLIYKGKDLVDFILSSSAGIFALCLLVFPTSNITRKCRDEEHLYSITILNDSQLRTDFHYFSAAVFLGCLAYMSLFIFTRSDKPPQLRGAQKKNRNRVFRTCGIIMILAIMVVAANFVGIISDEIFEKYHLTFWMEAVAIESFGLAWLTKAEVIFRDSIPPEERSLAIPEERKTA